MAVQWLITRIPHVPRHTAPERTVKRNQCKEWPQASAQTSPVCLATRTAPLPGTGGEPPLRSGESLLVSHLASVSPSHLASHPRILPLTLASCLSPSYLASHPRILPQSHPRILPLTLASCLSLTLASCPGEMVVTMSWTRAHPHHLTAGTCSRPPGRTAPLPSGSGHDGPSG